jgi:hypothetical protein
VRERDWKKDWELCGWISYFGPIDSIDSIVEFVCRVKEANNALRYWLVQIRKLEAQVAEMREVLEGVVTDLKTHYVPDKGWPEHIRLADEVLSADMDKELLGSVRRLGDVAEAAREYRSKCFIHECSPKNRGWKICDQCLAQRLDDTISTLGKSVKLIRRPPPQQMKELDELTRRREGYEALDPT